MAYQASSTLVPIRPSSSLATRRTPDFCFYPSWSKAATTTEYKLKDATDKEKDFKTINAKYTWNAWVGGSWG